MRKLNLGSVVTLKDSEKKLMVIGYNKRDENGDIQRYEATHYPTGITKSKYYYFLDEDIKIILDSGYEEGN